MKQKDKERQLFLSINWRNVQYGYRNWKNFPFDRVPKIILHLGGTNNIFVDFCYFFANAHLFMYIFFVAKVIHIVY